MFIQYLELTVTFSLFQIFNLKPSDKMAFSYFTKQNVCAYRSSCVSELAQSTLGAQFVQDWLTRLTVLLAQIKARNDSCKLKIAIRQIVYLLY